MRSPSFLAAIGVRILRHRLRCRDGWRVFVQVIEEEIGCTCQMRRNQRSGSSGQRRFRDRTVTSDRRSRLREEGPLAIHTGTYSMPDFYPDPFNIQGDYHRKDAIYPATSVGVAAEGRLYMAARRLKLFSALSR